MLPLIRKGLVLGWKHHEVLHRGSWQWHLGSLVGGLPMPQFPLKEGVSMQVGGCSRGVSERSSWERVWIREPEDGGRPPVSLKFFLSNSGFFEIGKFSWTLACVVPLPW